MLLLQVVDQPVYNQKGYQGAEKDVCDDEDLLGSFIHVQQCAPV